MGANKKRDKEIEERYTGIQEREGGKRGRENGKAILSELKIFRVFLLAFFSLGLFKAPERIATDSSENPRQILAQQQRIY